MSYVTDDDIKEAAKHCKNKTQCCAYLGIDYSTLHRRIKDKPELKSLFPSRYEVEHSRTPGCVSGANVVDIKTLAEEGYNRVDTATKLNVSYSVVYRVSKFYKIKFNLHTNKGLI